LKIFTLLVCTINVLRGFGTKKNSISSNSSVENLLDDENEPLLAREVISGGVDDGDVIVVQRRSRTSAGSRDEDDVRSPPNISSYYNITEIIEMGKMASLFFNKFGKK
jgi:hypothetical protein